MKCSLIFLFVLPSFFLFGQEDIRKAAKDKSHYGIDELVSWAKKSITDDKEICRFFYYWTAENIDYNLNAGKINEFDPDALTELPKTVMKSRRAVCSGYAVLYQEFLRRCGIECTIINGISKTQANILQDVPYQEDHAWNAFRINGKWYLADVAWANTTARDHMIDDFYFMTDPRIFIVDHYPSDPAWQLLDDPISLQSFIDFPCFTKKYFQLGFGDFVDTKPVKQKDGSYLIKLGVSSHWIPAPVNVNRRDEEAGQLKFELIPSSSKALQSMKVFSKKNIVRIDAVHEGQYSITTELGLVYFVTGAH